jgi:hypothetical protein
MNFKGSSMLSPFGKLSTSCFQTCSIYANAHVIVTKLEQRRNEDAWKDRSSVLPFASFVVQVLVMRLL